MRKIAKFLSFVLAAAMVLGMCAFGTSAASFKDVSMKDEALYRAVTLLNSLGIAKGTSDTAYGANKSVTREQMAAFIYRLMKQGKSQEGGDNLTTFTDLKDPTFYYMISWASENGIIKGRSDTVFDPSGKIILQDCYVMLVRALGYEKDETLGYPYGYIDVAERIGLDEDLDSKVTYTTNLTRGDVAIILYNAFYAEMNETYRKTVVPPFEKPGETVTNTYVYENVKETVCHKIYGVEEIFRRVVATPSYALDITALGTGSEYQAYKPLGGEKADKDLIATAAIVPEKDSTRLAKEKAVIEFDDLGLSGSADDYFLCDLTIYMKNDGTVLAASSLGKSENDISPSAEERSGTDEKRDYYSYSKGGSKTKLRTGLVTFGTAKAWFFNKPASVPNTTISIYPVDGDGKGGMTFKAGYNWCGRAISFDAYNSTDTVDDIVSVEKNNYKTLQSVLSTSDPSYNGKYSNRYYDCNGDGYVDYLWTMPYTWGKVVDKAGESSKTTAKHVGDSSYRAVYNSTKKIPEIYVGGAKVEGGSYKDGQYVFAYVVGPANYIKIASDDVNNSVKTATAKCIAHNDNHNETRWDNGLTVYAYNSGNIIVGHLKNTTSPTGMVSLGVESTNISDDFAGDWISAVKINSTWELTYVGNRILMANLKQDTADVAKQYAVVQYVNEPELQVVFRAGGIAADGTLESDEYVRAYIDGVYSIVKQAQKTTDGVRQDDNYYVDNGIVNAISTYEVNSKGEYIFTPLKLVADAKKLADDDESATYGVEVSNVSLDKFQNKLYRFVANGSTALPSSLAPNGMKYVSIEPETKIVVRYVDNDGESDFVVYDSEHLPDFDATDESMKFTKAIVILKNRPDSTTTEYLSFMYCEIGGDVVNASDKENYRVILSSTQTVDDQNRVTNVYKGVDPMDGKVYDTIQTAKTSSVILPKFALYKINEAGDLMNTTSGLKANLVSGSSDILTLEHYEADAKLIFVEGSEDAILVKDETVFALLDREDETLTIEDADMLSVKAEDDTDNTYYTDGETTMKLYMITDKESGDDFRYAKLVIVVRG